MWKLLLLAAGVVLLWAKRSSLRRFFSSFLLKKVRVRTVEWKASDHGGLMAAKALKEHGVKVLFTLTGGHIAPILVGAKKEGIRVVDVRHEVTAAFAADAISRTTNTVGVACVTAGPGLTNTLTAVKNAQMAQSPLVLLGGATTDVLKGRGSLQDIDQFSLFAPHVKWMVHVRSISDIVPCIEEAFYRAQEGVPGPVFVEFPLDTLYRKDTIVELYNKEMPKGSGLMNTFIRWYLRRHVKKLLAGTERVAIHRPIAVPLKVASSSEVEKIVAALLKAERPAMLLGAQVMLHGERLEEIVRAVEYLQIPVWLSSAARGLLGVNHPLQHRHKRSMTTKKADFVLLAGVVMDFRLGYGQSIAGRATLVSINIDRTDLFKNRTPTIAVLADPGKAVCQVAEALRRNRLDLKSRWVEWRKEIAEREEAREKQIVGMAKVRSEGGKINPVVLCKEIEAVMSENATIVADGGDFVGTASYTVWPRGPRGWLDPGPFGTLGVGGGFAVGAGCAAQMAAAERGEEVGETWLLWGDGACGFSLSEMDTMVRHGVPVIAVVGNDAAWMQILRDQVDLLGDDVGATLAYTDYHRVAEGFGAHGIVVDKEEEVREKLLEAVRVAKSGKPVLVNCLLGRSDFRKGSLSM